MEHRYSIYFYDLFGDYDNIHRLSLFIIIFTITKHSTLHLLLITFNNYLVRITWKYWFARRYVWHVFNTKINTLVISGPPYKLIDDPCSRSSSHYSSFKYIIKKVIMTNKMLNKFDFPFHYVKSLDFFSLIFLLKLFRLIFFPSNWS